MNHIYKSIFNKALGVFTAVPEFASAHGKGSERTVVGRVAKSTAGFAASALAISVGLALTSTSAVAGPGIYINDVKSDDGCVAIPDASGPNVGIYSISNAGGGVSASILAPGQVAPDKGYFAMNAMAPCLSSGNAAQALNTQTNRTLFYGNDSYGSGTITNNGAKNLTLGGRLDVNSGIIGVGDRGVNGTGATNSIRMGTGTTLDEANKQENAISIGVDAGVNTISSIAIGDGAKAGGKGTNDPFDGDAALAIGHQAQALGTGAVALGQNASVKNGHDSVAIGVYSQATSPKAVSIGAYNEARGVQSTVIGSNYDSNNKAGVSIASGTRSQIIGVQSTVSGDNSVSIGDTNTIASARTYAIGNNINVAADADDSLAFGSRAHVSGINQISIGTDAGADAKVPNKSGIAIGRDAGRYLEEGSYNTAIGDKAGQYVKGSHNIALGFNAGSGVSADKLDVTNTTAIGNNATALTNGSISIGLNAKSGRVDKFNGENSVAIGFGAQAFGTAGVAIGEESATTNGHNGVAIGAHSKTSNEKAISIGAFNTASGAQSIVMAGNYDTNSSGPVSVASGTRATVIGAETTVSGNNSLAIGDKNTVASNRTYAIGNNINAAAGTDDSLVFGTRASVGGNNAIAMGNTATASASGAVAISNQSKAKTTYSIALGQGAVAGDDSAGALNNGEAAIAIGREASANVYNGIALGKQATVKKDSSDGIAIGSETKVNAYKGTAIGAFSEANGSQALAIGNNKQGQSSIASGERSQVIGVESNVSGQDSTAIGYKNTVAAARTYAMGNNINVAAGVDDALAFGTRAAVEGENTIAMGNTAKAHTENSISIGKNSESGKVDKFDGKQSVAIGFEAKSMGTSTIAMGSYATSENGHDGVAIGTYAKTGNEKAITIGAYSSASGAQSIVIANNYNSDNSNNSDKSTATGRRAIVMGAESHATAEQALAIGDKNTVAAARTYAIGNNINVAAGADDALAFGTRAAVGGANTVAIGANANAAQANSVALGAGSATSAAHTTGPYTLNGSYTAAGQPVAANGTVSVGSAGKERQIQNVAAGVISATSTDAINGSQLYATNNYMNNFAGDVKTKLGGNAALGNDGHLTMTNIGGTGENTVDDAIKNLKTAIDNKADTTASVTSEDPADIKVDKEAPVGNTTNYKLSLGNDAKAKLAKAATALQTVEGDSNITATKDATDPTKVKLALNKNLTADSVTLGDKAGDHAVVNKDGLTIANGPSVKKDGINAGNKKITGVADGNVAAGSKDAVNGGQLAEVKAKADSAVQDVVSSNPTALTANKVGNTVTLTPNFIAGNLVNADGTVNAPAAADEGKLVSAKTVADALKANHFVVDTKANGGTVDATSEKNAKVGSGNKVTFEAGKNLVAQQTNTANGGATVNYKLSDTLENLVSVKSAEIEAGIGPNKVVLNNNGVKVGDSTLNDKGLTINNGPSVTDAGINAGDKKITGVANGNVAAGSTDAVNGGQLAEVKAKADTAVQDVKSGNENALTAVKDPNTNIVTVTPKLSGDLVDANGNITAPTTPADKGKLVTAGTVAEALANTHFVVDTKATDGELDAASQADQKIKAGNKVTLQAGKNLKAKQTNGANGAEVEFSLKDSISLKEVKVGEGSANEVVLNDKGVNVAGNTYINKDGLNANGNKVANVKAGDVSATSTDAVNGAQLHNVATSVANVLGGNAAVDGNGNVTSSNIGGTGANTVDDAIKAVNATAAKHTTVVEGKNVKVTKGKNAAGGDEYTVATKDDLDVTSVTAGNTTVNNNGLTITGGPSVTRGGIDAGNRVISGVKAGDVSATSQEAVNGSQLHATNTKLDGVKAKADTAVQDVKSGDENALTAVKDPNTNIVTVTPKLSGDLVDADGNITAPTTPADKGKLVTAGTVAQALANTHFVVDTKATDGELDSTSQADQKIKAGNKVTLQAGKNLKAKQTNGADGAQVEFSLKDSISLTQVTAGEGDNQVVLGNDGVKVGGNTYINKDGLNANNKPISNVADGVKPTDAVNKGQLDAVKGVADSAVKSVDVANGEQNLVVDNSDPKNPKLSLKKDLTVDSVKAGDSTLNNDGLTIAGGPSVKKDGINAGDKTITNVAPGAVTPTSKDAVNGGQLYNVANNVKDLIGPDATIDPATGKVTVADPAKGIGETGKGNIGDAIKHVNDAAKAAADTAKKHTTVEQGDNIVVEESLNADGGKHYKVSTARDLNVDSVKAGDTTVNNDGVTIAGGPSVTKAGINAGGNTITNVADGVNPNDAVNKGQLDAVKGVADSAVKSVDVANGEQNLVVDNSDPKNPKLSLKKDLTVDSVTAGDSTLNNDGLTIAGGPSVKKDGIDAGDKKITNVAAGDVAENSKDAVNGGQLYDVAKNVADLVGPDAKIDPATGKVTVADPAKGIGETGKGTIGEAIKSVKDAADKAAKEHTTVKAGKNIEVTEGKNAAGGKEYTVKTADNLDVTSVKAGDTTVNNDGVTIAGGPSVTKGGINAGGNTITNVADGVNPDDAVNKGQLDKVDTKVSNVAQNVVNVLGGDATVNGNGDITMSNIGETGKGNINDAIKSVNDLAKKAAAEKTSVKAKEGRSNVTVTEGVNAAGGHEYTVDVERSVTNAGSDYVTVTNNHDADSNTTTYTVDVSAKTKASLAKADSAVQGLTSKDGNLNFTKGANGNVEVSFNDNLNVKNVTTDRVQVANGPSMSKDGINAAGKAISNVANGNVAADSKDAVNGGQLHETAKSVADVIGGGATVKDGKVVAGQNGIGNTGQNTVHGAIAAINQNTANNFNQIRGDLRKMDRDLRGGIAGALATAGLPQAFRPGKSMVAAAASTYRGQSGLAIGVSRISDNGKVILKVTGNTNSRGDFGGTIGAGYQW